MDIFAVTILISLAVYVVVGNYAGVPMYALMAWLVHRALMKDYQQRA